MPPAPRQLDQISQAIGRLEGKVDGIDAYVHDREHNIANLTQKVDGLGTLVSREIASAKAEINTSVSTAIERVETRLQAIDERVTVLEKAREQQTGAKNLLIAVLQSPLVGWIFALAALVAAWWKGKLG